VARKHRGCRQANRLGVAVQLCTLPWLGFVPDDLATAPAAVVRKLAERLGTDPARLAEYGGWDERTRTDHLREVLARLGWRTAEASDVKALEDFLAERALEHDSPSLLLRLGCDHLRAGRVVRPGVERLQRWVASARERAWRLPYSVCLRCLGLSAATSSTTSWRPSQTSALAGWLGCAGAPPRLRPKPARPNWTS